MVDTILTAAPAAPATATPPAAPATPPAAPAAPAAVPSAPAAATPPAATPPAPPAAPAPPAEPVYELKAEGGDKAKIDDVVAFAKANAITPAAAQKMLERETALATAATKAVQTANEQALAKNVNAWREQVQADPELGGAEFAKNAEAGRAALARFASPKLIEDLKVTGFGNHPELVRAFVKIGKAMAESSFQPGAPPAPPKKSAADILFGSP